MAECFVTLKSPVWEERMPGVFLSSIESNGTQYINTDILPKNNLKFKAHFFEPNKAGVSSTTQIDVFGSYQTYALGFVIQAISYAGSVNGYGWFWTLGGRNLSTPNNEGELSAWNSGEYNFDIELPNYSINGKTVSEAPVGMSTNSITLFWTNGVTASNHTKYRGKLDYSKILYGDTVVRDLRPFLLTESVIDYWGNSQPSGAVGMWDMVSNKFFPNNGTGNFIAGEPV